MSVGSAANARHGEGLNLRILHVIGTLAPRYGGPSQACPEMARAVARRGHEVQIFTTNRDGPGVLDVPTDRAVERDGFAIRYFPVQRPRAWFPSWPMARALAREIPRVDIVHMHSLYMFHDLIVGRVCRENSVPYILRPHGTLNPYIHPRHRWRKRVMELWYQDSVTRGAAALHYTTDEEMRLAEPYVFGNPGIIVPNGIETEDYAVLPPRGTFRRQHPELGDGPIILFFGRINFKKGIDVLASAFREVAREIPDANLVIAGPDGGLRARTETWIKDYGLSSRVLFTGMLRGADKLAVLADSDLFVLPSYSENFGIAVVEAMACGLPVLISDQVGIWREVVRADAGVVVPPQPDAVTQEIIELIRAPDRRAAMGAEGRRLAVSKFDWDQVGAELERAYREILAETPSAAQEVRTGVGSAS